MKLYTSYWSKVKALQNSGIQPIAICIGKPKWWAGRSLDMLAPSWAMMHLDNEGYCREYRKKLARMDPQKVLDAIKAMHDWGKYEDVALMCYEKNPEDCHRSMVSEWLNENGIECEEWNGRPKKQMGVRIPEQLVLFDMV